MMKAKVFAPVNLALIKYWGKKNTELRIPANSNLSICLNKLGTRTEVEFKKELKNDEVIIDDKEVIGRDRDRVVNHLNKIRKVANKNLKARVVSKNNFPKKAGLSSSASGFAALTLAGTKAIGLNLNKKDLSRLARMGSGSACRSIDDGWVEWLAGDSDKNSYGKSIFSKDYWEIRILVVVLSQKEKRVSSTDGHAVANTSPFFKTRLNNVNKRLKDLKEAINQKDFSKFGELIEDDCLSMHSVMLTSKPNLVYWLPETVRVMRSVQSWRENGLESYFTVNTGQNVFVVCKPGNEDELADKLSQLKGVIEVRRDGIGKGARLV
ncbi:MAG: diphosphomevalonate decarboxylase [Patescibacteria group bacterium]|nr:diphosphomevalonate decarboxylase [Patescibacteria group bacterium]